MKTLGQRIRELREHKDLSLREFVHELGDLSAAFVSDVELGRRFPSDKVLAKMAPTLGTTIADLKSYDTRPPVDELKRLSASDPTYGLALRKVVEKRLSAEELMKLVDKATKHKKK